MVQEKIRQEGKKQTRRKQCGFFTTVWCESRKNNEGSNKIVPIFDTDKNCIDWFLTPSHSERIGI